MEEEEVEETAPHTTSLLIDIIFLLINKNKN